MYLENILYSAPMKERNKNRKIRRKGRQNRTTYLLTLASGQKRRGEHLDIRTKKARTKEHKSFAGKQVAQRYNTESTLLFKYNSFSRLSSRNMRTEGLLMFSTVCIRLYAGTQSNWVSIAPSSLSTYEKKNAFPPTSLLTSFK